MRNYVNTISASLLSSIALAADTGTGSAETPVLPEAKQPVPEAATVAAITDAEATDRKAKAAKLAAKRKAAKAASADKPATGKSAKASKRVAAKPENTAKPDAGSERLARIAADRSTVAALYHAFESGRVSVPVKALSAFKPALSTAHPVKRQPSVRQAAAIAIAFAAHGKKLTNGGTVNRVLDLNGVPSCVENGVLRDAISSGLCTVSGESGHDERIAVTAAQAKRIIGLIGTRLATIGKLA